MSSNARSQRAKAIMELPEHAFQNVSTGKFRVRSQTIPDKYYTITDTPEKGMVCECPDHQSRKSDCKHIKVVLEYSRKNKFAHDGHRIIDRSLIKVCKFCDSGNIIKKGFKKNGYGKIPKFKCKDCKREFTANFGFEKMRYSDTIITRALVMYFRGMSVRDIADTLEQEEIEVSHMTVYNWVSKYSDMISTYLSGIVPRVGDWFRADEVWVKVDGFQRYLFASMDDDTRFWLANDMAMTKEMHNADNLLRLTKLQAGKNPRNFITDGLPLYMKSSRRVFGKKTRHIRHIKLKGDPHNNKMERLNGEIRDREKVFRGLKKMDTPILDGMKAYYNYTKKHSALGGMTPAEAAKITVDGKNKLKTIIQNASLFLEYSV